MAKSKRIDESNIAKLVAEENEIKSKFPRYPGLERWKLLEKMGDGAFSNVYRALDTQGQHGEAAIKVVRKFEMNSMQVSRETADTANFPPPACLACLFLSSSKPSNSFPFHLKLYSAYFPLSSSSLFSSMSALPTKVV